MKKYFFRPFSGQFSKKCFLILRKTNQAEKKNLKLNYLWYDYFNTDWLS